VVPAHLLALLAIGADVSNQSSHIVVYVNVALSTRLPRLSLRPIAVLLVVLMLTTGCQPPRTTWADIPPAPSGAPHEGQAEKLLDERLASRVAERKLKVLGRRLEQLPADVTFTQHVAWRDTNANNMTLLADRIPEPDAPVMMAEFARAGRTLFVIGTVAAGRTVILTALTAPR
jgi:hypothetical protein